MRHLFLILFDSLNAELHLHGQNTTSESRRNTGRKWAIYVHLASLFIVVCVSMRHSRATMQTGRSELSFMIRTFTFFRAIGIDCVCVCRKQILSPIHCFLRFHRVRCCCCDEKNRTNVSGSDETTRKHNESHSSLTVTVRFETFNKKTKKKLCTNSKLVIAFDADNHWISNLNCSRSVRYGLHSFSVFIQFFYFIFISTFVVYRSRGIRSKSHRTFVGSLVQWWKSSCKWSRSESNKEIKKQS